MLDQLASHLESVAALAPVWGYALIFFFMAVESSFIPFPSEIVMIPAGFLAARGSLSLGHPVADLVLAVLVGVLGSLAGAYFNYWLSAKLGKPFLLKHGKWFLIKPESLERACEVFNRYGAATTFSCRLIPVIRQLISIPAGLAKMPLGRFAFFTALGAGIWSALLALVGYWLCGTLGRDASYRDVVHRGKDLLNEHMLWVIGGALAVIVLHVAVTKLVMRRR